MEPRGSRPGWPHHCTPHQAPEMYDASLGLRYAKLAPDAPTPAPQGARPPLALGTFLQSLRPTSLQEQRAQRAYRAEVQQIATRMQSIFDEWLSLRETSSDYGELANAAAVSRWELMRLAKTAEGLEAP